MTSFEITNRRRAGKNHHYILMDTQSVWVAQCRDAVQDLRAAVKQAKLHRAACCQIFAAALAAQLALEHSVHSSITSTRQAQQQQRLCASMIAAIELAHRRIQVFGSRSIVLRKLTSGRRWKHSALQKLQAVTTQLDTLGQQVWDLQADATDLQDRYHPEIRQHLESSLSSESAKEAAIAVASLTKALVSGLQDPSWLSPTLAALGSDQLVTSDQAIQALGAFRTLLGASPVELSPDAQPAHVAPDRGASEGRQHRSTQTSPASRSPEPGQIGSFDSATSHAEHTAGQVTRAMPPPPSHAEHAIDQQKRKPQLGRASTAPGTSWQSQAGEAHQRQSSMSEHWQGVVTRQHSQTSSKGLVSPFDAVRSHSYAQEGTPLPSDASELSQDEASKLPSQTGNSIVVSPFDIVRRQSSLREGFAPGYTHTAQSQADTSKPQPDMGQGGVTSSPSGAVAKHTGYANNTASVGSHAREGPHRQGATACDSPESQRVSQWAHAQMAQSQQDAHSSANLGGSAQSGFTAASGRDEGRLADRLVEHSQEILGPNAHRSTSVESIQPAPSLQQSRRSSLEALENLNCRIIEYDQLQIKRKIGDGSIGLVYLGKWQETDVAVKVLLDMQHLAPNSQVQPQDPATLEPWKDSPQANMPSAEQQGDGKLTAQGLQGITDVEGSDDCQSQAEEGGAGEAAIKTLEREVSIIASLRHPNVVMFMGLCLQPPCIITEFCARGSLFDVLRKARTSQGFAQQLDWSKRLSMALDAAKGVLHLHSHKPPILHRDLKSPNMVVERHWRVKVTDFNLSRMVQTSSPGSSIASLLANNPRWLAPEVVEDHAYSKAADVYSFGIIMWEMMTWDVPWEELNAYQIMLRLSKQDRPEIPPVEELPGQPLPGIKDYICLMKECWDQDPSKRPRFENIIVLIRGLLEGAASKQKIQKTLTAVPRLATTSMVPAQMNKLPVAGQNAYKAAGPDPQETPTPLHSRDKHTPLQVYETSRPFFGSAPVGGLDILCSYNNGSDGLENTQYNPLSGQDSQQALRKGQLEKHLTRRHTFNGTSTAAKDILETAPQVPSLPPQHGAS